MDSKKNCKKEKAGRYGDRKKERRKDGKNNICERKEKARRHKERGKRKVVNLSIINLITVFLLRRKQRGKLEKQDGKETEEGKGESK